ncbi:Inactive rhomboid protein 1 [Lucilia cuprina]|uniref:Inactive rhomboid protein 1 n=1 Tax=Lucilia cuprina TaxID=7375 RepID=A0A0L0C866_LUCCU|nr:Inactive rhomboid protein 1 [Lucilia cuprina]
MLSPKANIHCSNLNNCETELPDQQHLHRHPIVNGNSHSRAHNEQKFQQSQSQHLSSNINRRGSSSNVLPPHMTTLSSSSSVTNSTLRRKSSSCYQQQLLSSNAINCSTDTLNDCNNDISLTRYSPHPNDMFLQHQLYHQHRKPSLQPIERFEDSLACCLPPPSPAPNSDRFIEGTCVISPPSGGGPGQTEGQHPSQTQHQQQTLSSSTSNSSISTGVGSSSASSTCAFQPTTSHHGLKYSANQSINAMQRSISPSTTRFRINNDRYRDINSANSSPSVNTAPGSSTVVLPSSTRFVNLSSHFPYQNCTTPSLVSTDTYSYLASTVHTPVKRYVPTPPPPNQLYVSPDQHQQINIQTPTQIPANSAAITTKSSSAMNTSSGSSMGTSTSTTMPYRVHTIKCCGPDQVNDLQATLNLNQSNDFYSSSPRLRNSYNCSKTAAKDSSMMVNFNESQTAQQAISSKSTNMMASQNSSSTTQTHMVATIMGCGNSGISSPQSNINSRSQTYASRNGICSALNDLQEPMSLNSTIPSLNDVSQNTTCPNAIRSEENSTSAGISIGSGTSSTCLHCKTVRRTTGVHQTTQTTGPISPVPQMAPLIATNNNSNNNSNQGLSNEQMTNITMTLTPTPTESSNHLTPISPPTNSMTPSNRLLYKKLDISPDQMFPTQLKAISNSNQIVQPHINEPNQSQSSNLENFLPTTRTLNQQQLPSNQPISQPANSTLQQQQRYSCKKRFTQYMRREVLRFFGIEPSTEAEDYGLWQGRQRRLALRRFGSLKTESELQAEFNDVCSNDNGSGSMPRSNIHCSAFNNENQHHHYHHHHHTHQRHTTERPDILPIQDTEDDDAMLNNSGSGGDSTGNNGVNNGVNSIHGRGGRCQRDRYHHPHYNVDFQVGDHVERKASVASMLVQSFSFIKHTLNKHQTSRYKRRQWSRSFAPAHVQYHINNGGHVTSNEFYEGLSALQDDEVFFDSPPGVDSSGVMGSGSSTANSNNNATNISNSSVNSSMRVTSMERQMFLTGERSQQGWRTSNVIGQNDGSLTVHQPIVVHASAEQQITHQQHSMQQHQQQLHGIRGNRISAQLLDGVLENSQRPVARRIKLFCTNDLDDRTDHRPFFTYWINTVQIIVLFFSLLCYGIGPIGFGVEQKTGQVLVTSLSLQTVQHSEQRNLWIGPRNQDLVHMGAKFATCMRRDVKIIDVVMKTRRQERETACCIRNDDSGCVQSSQADCSVRGLFPTKSISTWKKWSPGESGPGGRISGSVCGLDPKYCDAPASIAPYEWPDDITKWPICRKTNSFSQRFRFKDHTAEHMVCEVIGHPCCTGIYGECQITTREYCDFVNGYFHEEASLCSQISCLSNVCGMFPFVNVEVPDQFYRLLTSLCMHAGILHLVITVVFQHIFLADLERLIGPIRTAILYIGTGLAGNLTSAVLVPYKPEVGPLASLSGVIASLVVLLIHAHWQQLHKPHIALFKLIVIGAVLFAIGTLPWQLNFASLFAGIFCGIFLTIALVPFISINKYKRKSKINLIWSCIIFHIFVYTTMLIIFYMFSSELTKLSFGEVFTNSFNTGVTGSSGGGSGATGSPGITTTDIMRTGISSNNNNNNNVNRHSFMQQQPLHHHYHHLSDDIITNNAAVAVAVATATLAVGGDGTNGIENVGREGSQVVMIN